MYCGIFGKLLLADAVDVWFPVNFLRISDNLDLLESLEFLKN